VKNCRTSSCSPHESVENTACRGHVSIPRAASATSWTWQFCWEAGILQMAQWQSRVALLPSVYWWIVTVSIRTTLMCRQMRIPTPLWKATFYVLVSMCGVQFWTISWLVLSSWKVVLQERCTWFLQEKLPRLLEDVPLNKRGRMYCQHYGAPPHTWS